MRHQKEEKGGQEKIPLNVFLSMEVCYPVTTIEIAAKEDFAMSGFFFFLKLIFQIRLQSKGAQ